jgi:Co/Zn/Cd efflux system component
MTVDVVTYLFNFMAERLKHQHDSERISARDLRLRRLYLELVPPLISVVTLIVVTIHALQQAFETLFEGEKKPEDQPDLAIMLAFSGLNLLLDILNVSCFARVDQAVGLPGQVTHPGGGHHAHHSRSQSLDVPLGAAVADPITTKFGVEVMPNISETTPLLVRADSTASSNSEDSIDATGTLNLNMCSAWTHVCADTLRSIAVLLASAFAYVAGPGQMTAGQADSGAAIVVSIIILISLVPLIQGLYLTACKIYIIWFGHSHSPDTDADDVAKLNV